MKATLVREIVDKELKSRGLKKRGARFERTTGKVTVFVWLDRSRFAPQYFLEMGAVYAGGPQVSGQPPDWHVRERAEELSADPAFFRSALNEDSSLPITDRQAAIAELIRFADEHYLTPWGTADFLLNLARREANTDVNPKLTTAAFRQYVASLAAGR